MTVKQRSIEISTHGNNDILNITNQVSEFVRESGVKNGLVLITVPGSTAGLTTIEFEAGVLKDLQEAIERLVPSNKDYHHDARWGDGNGFSHVRSALIPPTLSFQVAKGRPLLGTWQQVVLVDFDNRQRNRSVNVMVMGE